ncbi:MAG: hypothetical protein U9R60_15075 [Bacteroidota bacterium]|nr:hypothetical protein [Bacteroidota bacterium]
MMNKQNYKLKNIKCPYCGGTFECLSHSSCRCGISFSEDAQNRTLKTVSQACPCPECVRILASQSK